MGLWVLEGCRREWGSGAPDIDALVAGAGALSGPAGVIDVDDLGLLNPPSMIRAIHGAARRRRDSASPRRRSSWRAWSSTRSRSATPASSPRSSASPARRSPGIHVVGGGSRNAYLNQATADATGKPVLAGPVEATAAGNVIVQAVASGSLASIAEGRPRSPAASPAPLRAAGAG